MDIKLIRLHTFLNEDKDKILKEDNEFIEDLNDELLDDDIVLTYDSDDSIFDIVYVESGGCENQFIDLLPSLTPPVVLLTTSKNNSLPACFEIRTYLSEHNIESVILTGASNSVTAFIRHLSPSFKAIKDMKDKNLGVIGKPSDWLIASTVDYSLVKNKFDINLIDISIEELYEEIDKKELVERIPHIDKIIEKFTNKEVLVEALYIYSALKRIVTKYNLEGLTVRCFDLLGRYKNTSCLALGLLNEEGIISACEGDVPSLLTMYFIYKLKGLPSFMANPSEVDFKKRSILLAHCTVPFNMINKYELLTHFESNLGIGIKGEMNLGNASLLKLCPDLKRVVACDVKIKENLSLPNFCRTQIRVELDDENMFSFFREDFGNHLIITYGEIADVFTSLVDLFNTRYHEKDKDKNEEK